MQYPLHKTGHGLLNMLQMRKEAILFLIGVVLQHPFLSSSSISGHVCDQWKQN
eukprot:CAMPEP_0184504898 /NCGR_PEP_ID=MMETSP0113_2-20130426/52705_1 /TAXON_ID=91329 /ORGANISM="Norrisiella sphaerica, Strain BC52" /LENGTH=52 /DNA_ID=CAMNT_0026894561 /DNA_START=709 /DNA_END=867 /DNA_ORIENTATION=-